MEFGVSSDDATTGGMKGVFFDGNGLWLELILPTSPGPGMDILNEKGSGAIMDVLKAQGNGHLAELVIEVDDMAKYYDAMHAKGVQMAYADGTPIPADEKFFVLEPYGSKAAYFPKEVSQGMTIEVTQRGPRETCLLHKHKRDADWS